MESKLIRAGILLAVCAVLGCGAAWPGSGATAARLKQTLQQRYPRVTIRDVLPSAVPGIYEVFTGKSVIYSDATGDHVFVGRLVDTRSKRDLTTEALDARSAINFKELPFDRAIKIVKGDGHRQLAIFEDPDCPYCRRLEQGMSQLTDLTVYIFLYPLEEVHPGATSHALAIWCAPDRASAWRHWMLERTPPAGHGCANDPLAQLQDLGKTLNVDTTPTLFLQSGHRFRGALSAADLEKLLNSPAALASATPAAAAAVAQHAGGS